MDELAALGFQPVGAWRTKECVVHKDPMLKHQPGLYAFVVGDAVRYIGKAKRLHRRLRRYSNRFPDQRENRPWRRCHAAISKTINAGGVVQVYAWPLDAAVLDSMERKLIGDFTPAWNG